jgi:hypothetical protein
MMEDKDIEEYNKISWELKWNKKFEYPKSQREIIKGRRHYSVSDQKLPSVTFKAFAYEYKSKQLTRQQKINQGLIDKYLPESKLS